MTTPFLQTAGWTLIHFLWQGCAIAGVAAVLLRLAERRSANARYLIACAGLIAMVAAPAVTARLLWHAASLVDRSASGVAVGYSVTPAARLKARAPSPAVNDRSARLQPSAPTRSDATVRPSDVAPGVFRVMDTDRAVQFIAFAWLLGVTALLVRLAGGWWHVRTLHRAALAATASRWQSACRRIAHRLRLPAAVHVVESIAVDVPTVVGWMRPVILLPVAAVAALTPAQVEAILAHELAHIRRHDYAVNLLQTIAETLLFYHPGVWWISKRIRAEREHCCDDVAVRVCGDAVSYAQALAELESWRVTATAMAVAATGGSLLDRVRRILREPLTDEPRSPSWAATLVLTLVFTAGAGAVQQLPSWIGLQGDARAASRATGRAALPTDVVSVARLKARAPSSSESRSPGPTHGSAPTEVIKPPLVAMAQPPVLSELALRPFQSLRVDLRTVEGRQSEPVEGPQPPAPPEPPEPPTPPDPPDVSQPPTPPTPPEPPEPPEPPAPPARAARPAPPVPPPVPPAPPTRASRPAPPAPPAPPSPPSPPSPPAPPEPPAPPAPGSFSISSDGQWRMQWRDGTTHVDVRLDGTITFTDDLTDVQSLSDGGELTIRDWSHVVPHTIEIRSSGGRLTRTYYVAGVSRGWDDEARRDLAEALPRLVRRSGLGADARVKSIVAKKGVSGVLDEIALLESDYARRLYFVALVENASLDSTSVQPVLAQVTQRMTSDYDRRQVLQRIVGRVRLDQRAATAFVQALEKMRSDYDRRQTLKALFDSSGQLPDGEELYAAIGQMRSSYDKRQVLTELMARPSLTIEHKQAILRVARGIQSDYDRGQVLAAYVQKFGIEAQAREPFFQAVGAIQSAFERRRVLTEIAKKGAASADVQRAAFELVGSMASDHDRAETLLAFLGMQPMDASTRQAFVAAAERIRSSHDQNRVLAALVRSERR